MTYDEEFKALKNAFDYAAETVPLQEWKKYLFEFVWHKWQSNFAGLIIEKKDTSQIAEFSIDNHPFVIDYNISQDEDIAIQKRINNFYSNIKNANVSKYIIIQKNDQCFCNYECVDNFSGMPDTIHQIITYRTIDEFYNMIASVLPDEAFKTMKADSLLKAIKSIGAGN